MYICENFVSFKMNVQFECCIQFFELNLCTFRRILVIMNLSGFIKQKLLGKGTYGSVYKAIRLIDCKSYAIKVVNFNDLLQEKNEDLLQKIIKDSLNEIRLMASFASPFIVRFYEAFRDNRQLYIISEYAKLGDLAQFIQNRKLIKRHLKEDLIWLFLIQLLEGLRSLHSCGVIHRDLKSSNILLVAPDLVKIADLGVSTVLISTKCNRTQIGTPLYMPPEIWENKCYDQKCDMWSLGIILYEMMTFTCPFNGNDFNELAIHICSGRFQKPKRYSNDLVNIVCCLLQVDPQRRPTVVELMKMKCIKEKMPLLKSYTNTENMSQGNSSTIIRAPLNTKSDNLPPPTYNKADIVKPIENRIHVKQGFQTRKEIAKMSTPDIKKISDLDLWSPNRASNEMIRKKAKDEASEQDDVLPHIDRQLDQKGKQLNNDIFSTPRRGANQPRIIW